MDASEDVTQSRHPDHESAVATIAGTATWIVGGMTVAVMMIKMMAAAVSVMVSTMAVFAVMAMIVAVAAMMITGLKGCCGGDD